MNEKMARRLRRMKRILDACGMKYTDENISWAAIIESTERAEGMRITPKVYAGMKVSK